MDAVDLIAAGVGGLGYRPEAVMRGYRFADVLDPSGRERIVPLAAFTRAPPSYRSAAFGALFAQGRDAQKVASEHRALGAPYLFVIDGDYATVWQSSGSGMPVPRERLLISDVPALFQRQRALWSPDALHRAKNIGELGPAYQASFVDRGLLPLIEGEAQRKLDRLLREALAAAREVVETSSPAPKLLFFAIFRMLAAKVLRDRGHPAARGWDSADLGSVLYSIERYYRLDSVLGASSATSIRAFTAAWEQIRKGISFANLSGDDLAFVYEHTLVTREARRRFGIHGTPRRIAEFVVSRLDLGNLPLGGLHVYEPFAGAGVFLVAALRTLGDLLPSDWGDEMRHAWLVEHLAGAEQDAFACEVAQLSLILADYPNRNGWQVEQTDLFVADALRSRLQSQSVILCNPPFEAFDADDRARYPEAARATTKAMAALNAALDAAPLTLGFLITRLAQPPKVWDKS